MMVLQSDKLIELLVTRSVEGLTDDEERDLEWLLSRHPDADAAAFDRAAAAVHLTAIDPRERLPEGLRAALERDAAGYFGLADRGPRR